MQRHSLCVMCLAVGRVEAATVVDHVKPHQGDEELFWDVSNWQALCASCHSSHKQTQEKSGYLKGCDVNGIPIDVTHPWFRGSDE